MSATREVRSKIASIGSTRKITSAMEMVAASKMRKAQERMSRGRPYADKLRHIIGHMADAAMEYRHSYTQERPVQRVAYIIVTTDRGLCGGLNHNLLRVLLQELAAWEAQGIPADLCTIGARGGNFFSSHGGRVVASMKGLGDEPKVAELIGGIRTMLNAFEEKRIDKLLLASNRFVSTMNQAPQVDTLLPLPPTDEEPMKHHWDYIYEPDSRELIDGLMARYIESLVYQAVVENHACEQAARMVAMKNASENASELIDNLQLMYNKARQAAITQELAEIVGGAAAL